MKSAATYLVLGVLLGMVAASAVGGTLRDPALLKLEPLKFTMPQAVERRLSNGLRVLVFENHDLPLVTMSAHMTMGKYYVPVERIPAMDLLSRLWDEGGAGDHDPAQLDSLVQALGMTLAAGIGDQEGYVSAFMAREDLTRGAELWCALLLQPQLAPGRLARAKSQKIKDLQSINDDPGLLADNWFWRLLAGPESAEGRVATRAEVEAITRDELLVLHDRFVIPQNTVIGMAGDITADQAVELLEQLLGDWHEQPGAVRPRIIAPVREAQAGVYVLPGDYEQCHVRIGRTVPGLTELGADFPAVKLLDFGVGYLRVYYRTRRDGLSYGTGSRLFADQFQGTCMALGSTRTNKVVDLLEAVREEIANVQSLPLTDGEVETSRTFQQGAFIQKLETARDVVRLRLEAISLGLPENYYQELFARQQVVSSEQVGEVATRWLGFGDQPVLLVVGTPEGGPEVLEQLGLGPVHILEPVTFGE